MKENFKLMETNSVQVVKKSPDSDKLELQGRFHVEHWRDGKLLSRKEAKNLVTNVGKNYILDVMFNTGTQIGAASWVMGLIQDGGYTGIAAGDTMASHAGWTEFTGYSQANRPAWGQGAASGQAVTNASPVVFSITTGDTIKGFFIASQNSKGGTTGTLWSAALFTAGDTPVVNGDELRVTYTIGA